MALHAIDICAGYGGISLGLKLAGLDVRTVAYVERESHAAATLVARMEDQALDHAPIWDDINTFPADEFHGCVDIITGGIPCQPFSSAGKQQGLEDERWLWPALWSVVQRTGASWLFLENVPQFRKQGLAAVLTDLRSAGWDAEWLLLSAANVGAPHKRERFWLLARDVGNTDGRNGETTLQHLSRDRRRHAGRSDQEMADAEGLDVGLSVTAPVPLRLGHPRPPTLGRSFPPTPDDHVGWVEWLAGGGPEPQIRREPHGPTEKLVRSPGLGEQLHLLGNGVVPQCAAAAFATLAERMT